MKKKSIALLMALTLVVGGVVGGTIAWLTAETAKVENTFTFGDINIVLDETNTDADGSSAPERDTSNAYKLIPGEKDVKDPKVTVQAGSENCYVFVKVVEANNTYTGLTGKIIEYTVDSTKWLSVGNGIYVYTTDGENPAIVDASAAAVQTESVLAADANGNHITVNTGLTEAMITAIDTNTPVLTFDAAAVQSDNIIYDEAVTIATGLLATVA